MRFKFVHPENALNPTSSNWQLSVIPIETFFSAVQFINANSAIFIKLSGNIISSSFTQLTNALVDISFKLLSSILTKSIVSKLEQLANACKPIFSRVLGKVTLLSLVQPLNAISPIIFKESGKIISEKSQDIKAPFPIVWTFFPRVTLSKWELKASEPIKTTLSPIITFLIFELLMPSLKAQSWIDTTDIPLKVLGITRVLGNLLNLLPASFNPLSDM